jgi:hypothetical protein
MQLSESGWFALSHITVAAESPTGATLVAESPTGAEYTLGQWCG